MQGGIEDYYSYEKFDLGLAGKGYVNTYNNQLTYVKNSLSLDGAMPININMVYSDSQSGHYNINGLFSNMRYGNGVAT